MERGKEDEDARSYPLIPWSGSSAGPIWSSGSKQFQQEWVLGWRSYWKEKMHDYSWHIPRSIITSDTSLGPENKPVWKIEMNLLCSISGNKLLCCPSTNDAWKTFWIDLTWDMEVFPYENILHGLMKCSQAPTFLLVTWVEMFNSLLNALKALTNFKSGGKGEEGGTGRRRGRSFQKPFQCALVLWLSSRKGLESFYSAREDSQVEGFCHLPSSHTYPS